MIESRSIRKKEESDETADKRPLALRYGAGGVGDLGVLDEMGFEAGVWIRSDINLERPESVKATKERSIKHILCQSYP